MATPPSSHGGNPQVSHQHRCSVEVSFKPDDAAYSSDLRSLGWSSEESSNYKTTRLGSTLHTGNPYLARRLLHERFGLVARDNSAWLHELRDPGLMEEFCGLAGKFPNDRDSRKSNGQAAFGKEEDEMTVSIPLD